MFQNASETFADLATLAAVPALARTISVFFYVGVSGQRSFGWRATWLSVLSAAYLLLSTANIGAGFILVDVALTTLLLAAFSTVVYTHARTTNRGLRLADGAISLCLGLGAPLAILPMEMWPLAGPMGWEFALSAYSFMRQYRQDRSASLSDCLFFMIVSPVVVFAGHRTRVPMASSEKVGGLLRAAGGYASIWCGLTLQSVARPYTGGGFLAALVFCTTTYAFHSGRASVDVGVLRTLGYPVPERYRYPFKAHGPQDFWARWNTYVGAWAKEYLFFPSNRLGRAAGLSRVKSIVTAVLFTFGAMGLMHEFVALWSPKITLLRCTAWFLCNGVLLLAWKGASSRLFDFRWIRHSLHAAAFVLMTWSAKFVLG